MSLAPYQPGTLTRTSGHGIVLHAYALAFHALFHAERIYFWLADVAPVILKYKLLQLGASGIDALPLLSWWTKAEMKSWLWDYARR